MHRAQVSPDLCFLFPLTQAPNFACQPPQVLLGFPPDHFTGQNPCGAWLGADCHMVASLGFLIPSRKNDLGALALGVRPIWGPSGGPMETPGIHTAIPSAGAHADVTDPESDPSRTHVDVTDRSWESGTHPVCIPLSPHGGWSYGSLRF